MLNLRIGLFSNTQRRSCLYLQRPDSTLYPTRISASKDYRCEEIRGACLSSLQIVQKKKWLLLPPNCFMNCFLPQTTGNQTKWERNNSFKTLGISNRKIQLLLRRACDYSQFTICSQWASSEKAGRFLLPQIRKTDQERNPKRISYEHWLQKS